MVRASARGWGSWCGLKPVPSRASARTTNPRSLNRALAQIAVQDAALAGIVDGPGSKQGAEDHHVEHGSRQSDVSDEATGWMGTSSEMYLVRA